MYTVYTLIDPRDGKPFYIGMTTKPKVREKTHRSCSPSHSRKLDNHLLLLKKQNVQFVFWKIGEVETKEAAEWLERKCIREGNSLQLELSNVAHSRTSRRRVRYKRTVIHQTNMRPARRPTTGPFKNISDLPRYYTDEDVKKMVLENFIVADKLAYKVGSQPKK